MRRPSSPLPRFVKRRENKLSRKAWTIAILLAVAGAAAPAAAMLCRPRAFRRKPQLYGQAPFTVGTAAHGAPGSGPRSGRRLAGPSYSGATGGVGVQEALEVIRGQHGTHG